jgi:hypothetical protein
MTLSIVLNIFLFYVLFCVSVGITSWFTVYNPMLKELKDINEDVWREYAGLTTFLVTVPMTSLLAPIMLPIVLTGPDDEFKETFINNIMSIDED